MRAPGGAVEEVCGSGPRSRTPLSGSKARRATTTPARTVGGALPPRRAATHLKRSVARTRSRHGPRRRVRKPGSEAAGEAGDDRLQPFQVVGAMAQRGGVDRPALDQLCPQQLRPLQRGEDLVAPLEPVGVDQDRGPSVPVPCHLDRHRARRADRLHVRQVARRGARLDVDHHDRVRADRRRRGASHLHRAGRPPRRRARSRAGGRVRSRVRHRRAARRARRLLVTVG